MVVVLAGADAYTITHANQHFNRLATVCQQIVIIANSVLFKEEKNSGAAKLKHAVHIALLELLTNLTKHIHAAYHPTDMQRSSLFLVFVASLLLGHSTAEPSSSSSHSKPDAPKHFHQNMEQRREVVEGMAPVVRHLIHEMDGFIAELKEFREFKASRRQHHPLDGHPAGASLHRAALNDDMEESHTVSTQPHVAQSDHSSHDTHPNHHHNLHRDHDVPQPASPSSMTDIQWLQGLLGDSISDEQMKRLTKLLGQYVADHLEGTTKHKHGHGHHPHKETSSIKCTLCETMMAGIKPILTSKVALDIIEPIAVVVCEAMHPQCKGAANCKDLCTGTVISEMATVFES
jgi:hypothetical protein